MGSQQPPGSPERDAGPVRPWSAHDVAARYGRSVDWAWSALARWREAGLVTSVGTDSITGAALYSPEQVRAARCADLDAPTSDGGTRSHPSWKE